MPKITSSDIKKLPPKYHDVTRYPNIVNHYEQEFKDKFSEMLVRSLAQITKKMVEMKKKK